MKKVILFCCDLKTTFTDKINNIEQEQVFGLFNLLNKLKRIQNADGIVLSFITSASKEDMREELSYFLKCKRQYDLEGYHSFNLFSGNQYYKGGVFLSSGNSYQTVTSNNYLTKQQAVLNEIDSLKDKCELTSVVLTDDSTINQMIVRKIVSEKHGNDFKFIQILPSFKDDEDTENEYHSSKVALSGVNDCLKKCYLSEKEKATN